MKRTLLLLLSLTLASEAQRYEMPTFESSDDFKVKVARRDGHTYHLTAGPGARRTFDKVAISRPARGWRSCEGERISSPWMAGWIAAEHPADAIAPPTTKMDVSGNERRPIASMEHGGEADSVERAIKGRTGYSEVVIVLPRGHYEEWKASCPNERYDVLLQLRSGRNIVVERWWTVGETVHHELRSRN